MDFENMDISPELREKAKACQTPEELMELAKSECYELTDEQLDAISGGLRWCDDCSGDYCYFGPA